MSRNYSKSRATKPNKFKQGFFFLFSFLGGYFISTIFDTHSLATWIDQHLLNHKKSYAPVLTAQQPASKPKFEFYTLLAKDNTAPQPVRRKNIAKEEPPSVPVSEPPAKSNQANYLVQIASFNKRQDAEHLKASLLLKGYDVTVIPISKKQVTWFRVVIGPFFTRAAAEKAQLLVAESEKIKGMIFRA